MRDKQFYINAIKMDLHRVLTATKDLSQPIAIPAIDEFINHAKLDFEKIELDEREKSLFSELQALQEQAKTLQDPHERLRWSEKILTIRCRL